MNDNRAIIADEDEITIGRWGTAWQLSLLNGTFKAYYDLKRSQGLYHYGALGHVAHKFVRVLFKLLRDEIPFTTAKLSA